MRITTLIENSKEASETKLHNEHGLSFHISFQGNNILFDTGASDLFSKNADVMGIDLSIVHSAVISHHHYDHGGGLSRFLELNKDAKIYLREAPDGESYFRAMWFIKRYVGLDGSLLEANPDRFVFLDEIVEILPSVYIIPKIELTYPKPKGNKYLYVKKGSEWRLDDFSHELILLIKDHDGLVIFSGCSHNGMLNMIDTVTKKFGRTPIKAVIGGFHLIGLPMFDTMAGSRSEIEEIGRKTLTYPIESIYSGHCTGKKAYRVLKDVLGDKLNQLHTGVVIQT